MSDCYRKLKKMCIGDGKKTYYGDKTILKMKEEN